MKSKPNTTLPEGAKKILSKYRREIGSWAEMEYDAHVMRYGIKWLRVKGGFSGSGDREDWVADLPHGTLSVSKKGSSGFRLDPFTEVAGSFEDAIQNELKRAYANLKEDRTEAISNLRAVNDSIKTLTLARTKAALARTKAALERSRR